MILFLKQFLKWKGAKIVDFPLIFIVFEMTSGFVSFDYSSIFRLANDAIFRSKKKLDLNLISIHDNFVIYQKNQEKFRETLFTFKLHKAELLSF